MKKLAMTVGWRRNDAVSLLAQIAGGQAVALMALFLPNTYDELNVGEILFHFSNGNLHQTKGIASVKQLAGISTKVSGKLASMEYGNFLAEQVTRLRYSISNPTFLYRPGHWMT